MELGTFSVSLKVKDIAASLTFYQKLGFEALPNCGSVADKWLILQKDSTVIGLFQDMLDSNIFTFNPQDVRSIEKQLTEQGVEMAVASNGDTGPAHIIFNDPDGNTIMLDQH